MKKMTKVLALVLALAMCLALCACGKDESKDTAGDKKTFIMGVDPEYPPFSYLGDDGKFTGFDVEICQAAGICRCSVSTGIRSSCSLIPRSVTASGRA